ncbi:peptidylprolyl isomerase [Acidobacteria bacterium AB60]|nr:peptidylprolyl isomerase [Acidobacteria bacterium AB60]
MRLGWDTTNPTQPLGPWPWGREAAPRFPSIYNDVYTQRLALSPLPLLPMTLTFFRLSAASVLSTTLLVATAAAQSKTAESASPYGGVTVEDIICRVNDQIITRADYNRAMKEVDDEGRQHGATMQQISEFHKDLLRNLIDQQLWLSKGKELGVTGETELVNRLNDIRKQYNMSSLEDLEKAAQEQGVSYEDFKANIRNQIITQEVMRDQVGRHLNFTPGEVQRYFEEHKQEYSQPENVKLSEILISTGDAGSDDPAKVAEAKTKADDIEAKLKAGGDFASLARTASDQKETAAQGGDLGIYKRGQLNSVFENATFGLKTGEITEPIRTKQGFVILKVTDHNPGGVPNFKDVENQVEEAYYESKMEPAIRAYLTKMREDAYIDIKPGYEDTGASTNKRVNPITYSAYTPPQPKKKAKVERTRFRETAHFRQKGGSADNASLVPASASTTTASGATAAPAGTAAKADAPKKPKTEKPGKREKIRYGKAPTKTLPSEPQGPTEDAGAVAQNDEPENPLEQAPVQKKTRFSDRARVAKDKKEPGASKKDFPDNKSINAPDAGEVADRQTQSTPLGLNGNTTDKKKKSATTTGEKTRLSDRKKDDTQQDNTPVPTPIAPVHGAPAPGPTPTQQPAPPQ